MTPPFLERRAWRTVFFGLFAFPAFVGSAVLQLLGQRATANAVFSWIGSGWLGVDTTSFALSRWKRWAALPIGLVVSIITLYLLTGIVVNFGYPLRPGSEPSDWGGPSLAGRWIVHALGGVLFAVATPVLCGLLRTWTRVLLGVTRPPQPS